MLSFLLYNTVAQAVWCPFEPPAIGSVECPDGYICEDYECQMPSLGASTSDRVVCTVATPNAFHGTIGAWLCEVGEDCVDHKCVPRLGTSGTEKSSVGGKCGGNGVYDAPIYQCRDGLVCEPPMRDGMRIFGAYGTCADKTALGSWHPARDEAALGASANPVSGLGGDCGWPGYPGALTYDCEAGLICNRHGKVGGYGTCEQASLGASANPVSGVGGKCGWPGYLGSETFDCASGLICNRHGKDGGYGTCERASLGASANPVSGLGGDCGWPGYPGATTYDCEAGLVCNRHGKDGGYGTCEQAPLGASASVAQLGEECACADCGPAGITRPCAAGLICFNSCSIRAGCVGGMSTCQYPELGSSNPVSGLGGKCGFPGYLGGQTFDCASGLICNRHGKRGGYGTCEQAPLGADNRAVCTVHGASWLCKEGEECVDCAYDENCERKCAPRLGASAANPVSGVGGKCGFPGYLGGETYDCASGLICNRHGKMGGYGTCEQASLGASANPVSGVGGKCGWPGYLGAETFDCEAGLICNHHSKYGGYGTCEQASLGTSANPVSGLGGDCGWPGYPGATTYDCEEGLICNRHGKMGGYGTCEQASLGAGYHYCQTDADCPSTEPICHHPPKDFPELMPTCIADEFGSAPLGNGLTSCMTSADCPKGKTCVNPLVMGAPVEGWCA